MTGIFICTTLNYFDSLLYLVDEIKTSVFYLV